MTIDENQLKKAVPALLKFSEKEQENDLLDGAVPVWVQLALIKIPQLKKKSIQLPLVHSLYGEGTEICLITKDPQREFKDMITEQKVPNVAKVIGVTKLRTKHKAHEAKRLLCDSYDLFMADERVLPMLPKLIGKTFFAKKKTPIPVNLTKKNIVKEITQARDSTQLYLGLGNCCSIRVGHTGMTGEQIVANVKSAVDAAVSHVPAGWKNIKSVNLRTNTSIALPLYSSLLSQPSVEPKDNEPKVVDAEVQTKKRKRDVVESNVVAPTKKISKATSTKRSTKKVKASA
eukprot:CFRG7660T1